MSLSFQGLNTLDLSFNRITTLPEKVFNSVDALYSLNFAHNSLHTLHNELFLDNLFLTKIDLSNNNLVELDKKLFRYNKNVRQLNVSSNSLVSDEFLADMDYLRIEDLDLSKNPLQTLNFSLVGSMKNLRRLNVAQIELSHVDFTEMGRLKNLYSLNISYNSHLARLELNESAVIDNLARLYVDGVGLQQLNTRIVKRALPNLKHVSLAGNKWNCNYLRGVQNELRQAGVETIDSGSDCGGRPANLIAAGTPAEKSCVDEVALARIKVKEIIAEKLAAAETKIKDELRRIVNKKANEIIDEVSTGNHNFLGLVID